MQEIGIKGKQTNVHDLCSEYLRPKIVNQENNKLQTEC